MEITCCLVCRWLGFIWSVRRRPEGDCGAFVEVCRRRGLKVKSHTPTLFLTALCGSNIFQSLNIRGLFRVNHVHMGQSVVGKC